MRLIVTFISNPGANGVFREVLREFEALGMELEEIESSYRTSADELVVTFAIEGEPTDEDGLGRVLGSMPGVRAGSTRSG